MATREAVLSIIKQKNGITYNELLSKISYSYSNVNSARAALSRALKDMLAVGLVYKEKDKIYITEKGNLAVAKEMKHKLIVKLNSLIRVQEKGLDFDAIIQNLHTLIERSKQDKNLLDAARGSSNFTISDLEDISRILRKRAKQLEYLSNVLEKQIDDLKKIDFNDFAIIYPQEIKILRIIDYLSENIKEEFTVEFLDEKQAVEVAQRLGIKARSNYFSINPKQIQQFYKIVEEKNITYFKIYAGENIITYFKNKIILRGPHSKINKIKRIIHNKQ